MVYRIEGIEEGLSALWHQGRRFIGKKVQEIGVASCLGCFAGISIQGLHCLGPSLLSWLLVISASG